MATGVKCKNCYHYGRVHKNWCIPKVDSTDKDIIRDCQFFIKKTNADRIRAMSDEELALQLYLLRLDALHLEGFDGFIETKDEILEWLKEEVE